MGIVERNQAAGQGPIPSCKSVVLPMVLKNRRSWGRRGRSLSGSYANQAQLPSPDYIDRRRTRLVEKGLAAMHQINIWPKAVERASDSD